MIVQLCKKGEITVFLSLLLSSVLGLLCVTFKSAGNLSVKLQDEIAMDAALRSCFGEYHKELYEKYDLLYIDSSYRVSNPGLENTAEHISEYMQKNLDFDEDFLSTDYFRIEVNDTSLESVLLSSDFGALPIYLQAIDYMNEYGEVSHASKISSLRNDLPYINPPDIFGGWDEALERVNSFGVFFINPAAIVRGFAANGYRQVLDIRQGNDNNLSYNNIPSKRTLMEGNYKSFSAQENEIVFTEYLYQHCGSYIHPKTNTVLSGELEYFLYGYGNDRKNAEMVADRLIRIFSNENLSYLSSDEGRLLELHAYAEELVPPPVDPLDPICWIDREALVDAVADSLKYAWAECEGILKVDRLFGGGMLPANSVSTAWILPLREITAYRALLGGSGGSGYTYEEYLVSFFQEIDRKTLCYRFLDTVEMNMRKEGSPGFCVDGCIGYIEACVETNSIFGKEYSITRTYAYEDRYREKN